MAFGMLADCHMPQHPTYEDGQDIRDRSFEYACRTVGFCEALDAGGRIRSEFGIWNLEFGMRTHHLRTAEPHRSDSGPESTIAAWHSECSPIATCRSIQRTKTVRTSAIDRSSMHAAPLASAKRWTRAAA